MSAGKHSAQINSIVTYYAIIITIKYVNIAVAVKFSKWSLLRTLGFTLLCEITVFRKGLRFYFYYNW